MSDTSTATGLRVQKWLDTFFTEYVREVRFNGEMGTKETDIIQVRQDLSKGKGDSITFALVNKLTGSGVSGSSTLEGNEESMDSRSFRMYIDKYRNAVRIPEMEQYKSAIDLMDAGRAVLKEWAVEHTDDKIIDALGSINGTVFASADDAARDAWLVDNADRVLFGAAKSNNSSNDHSASLLNIDNTSDKLTPAALSLMKEIALTASPKIRPIRSTFASDGRRYYIVYANSRAFRDLKTNTTITQAQREVSLAMENERLFKGGDIYWDGMIVKEVEDIPIYTGLGAGGIDVAPVYLCGAQAIGVAYGKRWRNISETFDYGDKQGIGIEGIYGVSKMQFGTGASDTADLKDHGVVTGYFAAVAST